MACPLPHDRRPTRWPRSIAGANLGGHTLKPEEVRALDRDERGYTRAIRVSEIRGVPEFVQAGALLGHLWLEGHLGVGDPLVNAGAPQAKVRRK